MNASLTNRNSSASRLTQRQVKWLDSEIKSENKSRAKHQKSPLHVKYCYMDLGDHGNKNLLKQENIPSEYIISNGFDRYMMHSTTLDDLDQAIAAHSTNKNPKLLVINITDNTFVNGYLYMVDLQQPFTSSYPLSKSFRSLKSLLDNIKSKSSTLETTQPTCLLTHLLINSLVGNHFAKLFLETEQSPRDDDMPLIEQSILFAKELSSLDGFAVKNPVRQWFPGARGALQDGGLPNKALLDRLAIMEQGIKNLTLENKGLKEEKASADSQHRQQMEQHAKEMSLLEGSMISTKYDYQMALKDGAASKIELEQSTLRLRMYQEESIQLKKRVEEKTQEIMGLKTNNTALQRHTDQFRADTYVTTKQVRDLNTRLRLLEHEKAQGEIALDQYQQKTVVLEQTLGELRSTIRSSKAAEEETMTNFILQLHDQRKDAQGEVDTLQQYIDDLNIDLEQRKLRETGLEKEVLQVTADYLAEMQRCHSYEALFQALSQQIGQKSRRADTDLRIQAQQLEDQQHINDRQLHRIHKLEWERQQLEDTKLAEVQQLIDQHGVMDDSMKQLIQQNAMDKDDHQTALQRQIELLNEATNKLSVEKAVRLQESEDYIKEKAHYLEQLDEMTKKGTTQSTCIQKLQVSQRIVW
ncbi:hypothetical protein [Absidia glauca]|uniref:Uncharacterized protein n=1 Tax=Absidia glauca TaxID=4829 RepID=A0A163JB02_ABSGL|nr:hypothetical protein [Absidia glauca]